MADINILTCPDCGCTIPITEALSHQLEEKIKHDFEEKLTTLEQEKKRILEEQAKIKEETEFAFKKKEQELLEKSRDYLTKQQEKLQQEFISKEAKIKEDLLRESREKVSVELEDLKRQNEENRKRLEEQQKLELQLRQERREIEEKQKNMELDMMRRLDEEKQKMNLKLQEELGSKYKIQQLEYEKKLSDMQKALEDAQRKASASSERFRGEVQELNLEEVLRSNFIYDEIKEVPKGVLGADVLQEVRDNLGRSCGVIVWECKRTKAFNEDWITKLKDDVIRAKGNVAVLVTQTLPDDIKTFGYKNGVWVTDFNSYLELIMVLRMNMMELRRVEKLNEGKGEKMALVYNYLSSDEFRNKIVSLVETFKMMQDQLTQEKRAFQKQWSERERQLERMVGSTFSIVGDLQGVMGSSLPKIDGMDLPGLDL